MQNFVAIDFETANFEKSSVCSVGICIVKDGEIVDGGVPDETGKPPSGGRGPLRRKPLLPLHRENAPRPVPNYYCQRCKDVHGLGPSDTNDAPEFPEVWAEAIDRVKQYFPFIEDGEVPFVAHNKAFDENCLRAVFAAYDTKYPDYEFDCTLLKSRKVWPEGHHNLDIIAGYCGYDLKNHHHALADAEACAIIGIQIL